MSRRRWWIVGAIGVVAAIAVVAPGLELANRPASDCVVVRSMIDYNKQSGQDAHAQREGWGETASPDYNQWAGQLHTFAQQISDPSLEEHADKLADLADETAKLVPRAQADLSAMPRQPNELPPSAREYSRISKEFNDNLIALDNACPA